MEKCRSLPRRGGVNLELLTRIQLLEQEVFELKQSAVTVTNATDVTEPGIALDSMQNNASVKNSLRNEIKKINDYEKLDILNGETGKITEVYQSYVEKMGNIANINLSFKVGSNLLPKETLFVIPSGFRPEKRICDFLTAENGVYSPLFFEENGKFYLERKLEVSSYTWVHYYSAYIITRQI